MTWPCVGCGDDDEEPRDAGRVEPSGRDAGGGHGGGSGRGRASADNEEDGGIAGGGRGGRGGSSDIGARGGAGGGSAPNCRDPERVELSAWCAKGGKMCGISFDARLRQVCEVVGPNSLGTRAWTYRNDCGGRTINYVLAVDVYNETNHYDADGELIGVAVQPFASPCSMVRDVYGRECKILADEEYQVVDCKVFDFDAGS